MDEIRSKKIVKQVTLSTLIVNVLLAVGKLVGGLLGHSAALISDSVNSFGDVATSSVSLVGARLSNKAADKEHPFGHEKIESIVVLIIGMVVIFSGFMMGYEAVSSLITREYEKVEVPNILALSIAAVCIAVKLGLFFYTIISAKRTKSIILKANSLDHISDSIGTLLSLIGIIVAIYADVRIIDAIMSLVVCLFVVVTALKIIINACQNLLDRAWDEEHETAIKTLINSIPGVLNIDLLKTRVFGSRVYIELEISCDPELKLRDSHEIAQKVHDLVEKSYFEIKHVMIHVNPYGVHENIK